MANTYIDINLHLVFAVKYREASIDPEFRTRLFEYMAATISRLGHFAYIVGGVENHVHILLKFNATKLLPDLVRDLKTSSSKWINETVVPNRKFEWQRGYAAFSHSHRDIRPVANYIAGQAEHHARQRSFHEEIVAMFSNCGISYKNEYLFDDV